MFKKIIILLLSVSILFTVIGCDSSNKKTATNLGRYVEEEIVPYAPPDNIGELFLSKGSAAFIDKNGLKKYIQKDDKSNFDLIELPSLNSLAKDISITKIAGSENGEYAFSYLDLNNDDVMQHNYAYISSANEISKLQFKENCYITSFEFSQEGALFACDIDGFVYEIDSVSHSVKQLFSGESTFIGFDVVGDYIIAVDSKEILFYDYKQDKIVTTPEAMHSFFEEQGFRAISGLDKFMYDFCSGEDGAFYIVTKNGLYRYIMNGNQVEQLVDGSFGHFGNPSYSVTSVIQETEDSLLIAFDEDSSSLFNTGVVIRYKYDPTAINEITATLTIYSLEENFTLSQVINEYKTNNPTVNVNHEIGLSNGITYDDALKNLTTEILSGNAPDVMMLDGLDIDNYIEKHTLLDLSEYGNVIDPNDSLLDNIAKRQNNGGLYSMPCKFSIPVLIGWEDDLSKINNLTDLAGFIEAKHSNNAEISTPVTGLYVEEEILDAIISLIGNEIISEDGVSADNLKNMLDECARIYSCDGCNYTEEYVDFLLNQKKTASAAESWKYKTAANGANILTGFFQIAFGKTNAFFLDLNLITSLNTIDSKMSYRFGLTEDSSVYTPVCNLGVCASTKYKDEALQLLATAFSENVQNVEMYDGFPVNLNSLQNIYDKNKDKKNDTAVGFPDFVLITQYMDNSEVQNFQKLIERLDTPILLDTMTRDTIMEVGKDCLNGTISSEKAVDEIMSKLALRMKE